MFLVTQKTSNFRSTPLLCDAQGVVEAAVVDFEFAGPGLVAVAWP
jgi:hypothetical protein